MSEKLMDACIPVDIADDDIYDAMRDIAGYLDITPGDFKEVYLKAYHHAVQRLTRSVKAGDVMTRDVVWVSDTASLAEVAETMARKGISGLPVMDNNGRVVGVISEKDFLATMGPEGARTFMDVVAECLKGLGCLAAPSRAQRAADLMTSPAVTVSEETSVLEVAETLTRRGINRVPVIDHTGHLVGIISRADVVRSSVG